MRFDTHRVGAFLVDALQKARPRLEVIVDDGDIIHVRVHPNHTAAIYLVETAISTAEIRYLIETNTREGVYTLFVLWGELLMPQHGQQFRPYDWMHTLLALYGDKIYTFDPYLGDDLVYPVHFERQAGKYTRNIRYGKPIDASKLSCAHVQVHTAGLNGGCNIAEFEPRWMHGAATAEAILAHDPLAEYFTLLGIERKATPELTRIAVKHAFRRMARRFHPDVNASPGAADHMRRINEAYQVLLREI